MSDGLEDFVAGDVAEVEIGGKVAGGVEFGGAVLFAVNGEFVFEEMFELSLRGGVAAF